MARTKGDPTFVAVDDNAVAVDKPVHAATCRRIARNSNWLEAETHRVHAHQQWTQDNDVAGASRSATPLDTLAEGQVIIRSPEPVCLGPWRLDTFRPEVRLQLGGGLDAGTTVRYFWEFFSGNPTDRRPAESDWSDLENAGGAAAWIDSAVTTKRARAGTVDWVRLWVQGPVSYYASGQPDNTQGTVLEIHDFVNGRDITTLPSEGVPSFNVGAIQCETRTGVEAGFSGGDWTRFDDRVVVLFTGSFGAGSTGPTIDEVVLGPLFLAGAADRIGAGTLESLIVGIPHFAGLGPSLDWGDTSALAALVNAGPSELKYVIYRTSPIALRYVIAREKRLTSLAAGEPYRISYHPLDDSAGFTGNERIRHLFVSAQDNADALSLGQSQPLVNQRFDIRPDRGQTLHKITMDSSDSAFTTDPSRMLQMGCYAEADYEDFGGSFEYRIESTFAGALAIQARLVQLDDDGTTVLNTGGTVDLEYANPSSSMAETVFDQWWPGPWWSGGQRRMSPEMFCSTDSYTGTAKAIGLQLRAQFSGSAVVTVYVRGLYVYGKARRAG